LFLFVVSKVIGRHVLMSVLVMKLYNIYYDVFFVLIFQGSLITHNTRRAVYQKSDAFRGIVRP